MMTKKIYIFLTFALCLFTFFMISGCGKYITQYSAPVIIERYPVAGTGGIGSSETLWIKFSKSMDTNSSSIADFINKIKIAPDMTATVTFYPFPSPEATWSEDDSKLTITNVFFVANPGNRIHIQSSKEAFQDVNGQYLTENADLWNFTLSGLNIVDRYPTIDATISNVPTTIVATFDNSVATVSFAVGTGEEHTAGLSIPYPPSYTWTNSDKTLSIENVSWEASSGTVDVTYEAIDIYGNVVTNGQLFKFNVQ
jgi:hypothetical protein